MRIAAATVGLMSCFVCGTVEAQVAPIASIDHPSLLVDDFVTAMTAVAQRTSIKEERAGVRLWQESFVDRGIDPDWLTKRLATAKEKGIDPFAAHRRVTIDVYPEEEATRALSVALHAFRLDVVEDYDDVTNDDVYAYYITTHDGLMWGKVTDVYSGLDEGDAVFLSVQDRGVFGPHGESVRARRHLIVDFGLVESDGEDIEQLQRLSDTIIDLAAVALTLADPVSGATAGRARAETQNLLALIIGMDDDDRLVADTLHFTPDGMATTLDERSFIEFARHYGRQTNWTRFAYDMHWRLIR